MCVVTGRRARTQNARASASPDDQNHRNDNVIEGVGGGGGGGEKMAVILSIPSYLDREGPPVGDCCSICFGTFSIPCRANCGHWFCWACILQCWKFHGISRACECPMCCSRVAKLTPEAPLLNHQEEDVTRVWEQIQKYNRFFVGGVRGLVRRIFEDQMDPDGRNFALHENTLRVFAMIFASLYLASTLNFIPLGRDGVFRLLDFGSLFVAIIIQLVGFYRRRRLNQFVRGLDALLNL